MTFTPERKKEDMPKRTRAAGLLGRWCIVPLAVCLIAVGAYISFITMPQAFAANVTHLQGIE